DQAAEQFPLATQRKGTAPGLQQIDRDGRSGTIEQTILFQQPLAATKLFPGEVLTGEIGIKLPHTTVFRGGSFAQQAKECCYHQQDPSGHCVSPSLPPAVTSVFFLRGARLAFGFSTTAVSTDGTADDSSDAGSTAAFLALVRFGRTGFSSG